MGKSSTTKNFFSFIYFHIVMRKEFSTSRNKLKRFTYNHFDVHETERLSHVFFSHGHATRHLALLFCPSIDPSAGPSVHHVFEFS